MGCFNEQQVEMKCIMRLGHEGCDSFIFRAAQDISQLIQFSIDVAITDNLIERFAHLFILLCFANTVMALVMYQKGEATFLHPE